MAEVRITIFPATFEGSCTKVQYPNEPYFVRIYNLKNTKELEEKIRMLRENFNDINAGKTGIIFLDPIGRKMNNLDKWKRENNSLLQLRG